MVASQHYSQDALWDIWVKTPEMAAEMDPETRKEHGHIAYIDRCSTGYICRQLINTVDPIEYGYEDEGQCDSTYDARQISDGRADEEFAVHAQDGSCDQGRDVEIEEAAVRHERCACFNYRLRNDVRIYEGCASEDTDDRSAAEECLDDRCYVTDLVEKGTEYHKKEECSYHAARKYSQGARRQNDDSDDSEHLEVYSHDLDFVLAELFHNDSFQNYF